MAKARDLHTTYLPQIKDQASNLDLAKVLAEVKSFGAGVGVQS